MVKLNCNAGPQRSSSYAEGTQKTECNSRDYSRGDGQEQQQTVAAAIDYVRRGWCPIPYPIKTKAPVTKGWQHTRLSVEDAPKHFTANCNIGIILGDVSGGLTDIDLDCPETVELADKFLSPTGAEFGRASKPRSHRLYQAVGAITKKFREPGTDQTLVELRANREDGSAGLQTMAPPSIHPSGETVEWTAHGRPTVIAPAILEQEVAMLAAAALVVRHAPNGRQTIAQPPDTWAAAVSDPVVRARIGEWTGDTAEPRPTPAPEADPYIAHGNATAGTRGDSLFGDAYAQAALGSEVARVRAAGIGCQNDTLNGAAFGLGTLVGAGRLQRSKVETALAAAAAGWPHDPKQGRWTSRQINATIKSGLDAGIQRPRKDQEPSHNNSTSGARQGERVNPATGEVHDDLPPGGDGTGEPWPEPQPLGPTVPAAPTFPMVALPPALAAFVRDISDRLQCPPDLIALPALGAIAGCIGRHAAIRPKCRDDWHELACLWVLVIQLPGSMKTVAISKATAALRRIEKAYAKADAETHKAWAIEKAEVDMRVKAWESKCSALLKENPNAVMPPKPDAAEALPLEPKTRRLVTTDATVEKLADIMIESRGVTLIRDELAGLLLNMSRYNSGSDRQFYLESYSGGSFAVDRIGRGEKFVPNLYLNIIGGIQPDVARKLFDTSAGGNDGLLDRFGLIAFPDIPDGWTLVDRWPDSHVRKTFNDACDRLVATEWSNVLNVEENAEPFARFSPEAQQLFDSWLTEHMHGIKASAESSISGFVGKSRGLLCRIALVLHLFAWSSNDESNAASISITTLSRAITLLEDYLVPTWRRVMASFGNASSISGAHRIAGWILDKRPTTVRAGHIIKLNWAGLKDRAAVTEALITLLDHDWLVAPDRQVGPKGGRPSASYVVNPRVFEMMEAANG